MSKMDDELMKACTLYCEICNRTKYGEPKGMSIAEIRKNYNLKKRDIVVLLQFLNETAGLESCVDFVKYDSNDEVVEAELDNIDESAADGNIYICIWDNSAHLINNRMEEEDFNIQNDTLLQNFYQNNLGEVLHEISTISDNDLKPFIINKGEKRKNRIEHDRKLQLISAILNRHAVEIKWNGDYNNRFRKKIYPLGLRYLKLVGAYRLIYFEKSNQIEETDIAKICDVRILEEKHNREFHIDDYIEKKKTEKMVLKVYDEGNVIKKLDLFLAEYNVQRKTRRDYVEYSFLVEDAELFENMIKSFGRSIIVIEPEHLRRKIYQDSQKVYEFYKTMV